MDGVVVCRTLLSEGDWLCIRPVYVHMYVYVHTCVTTVASDTAVCV